MKATTECVDELLAEQEKERDEARVAATPTRRREIWEVDRKVRRRAGMEAVDAAKSNEAKNEARRARGERPIDYQLKFRSCRASRTETVILEARTLRGGNANIVNDRGGVRRFEPWPTPPRGVDDTDRRRKSAGMVLVSTMEQHGPVRIRDHGWLIDRLLSDGLLLNEGRILWDKQRDRFHLVVRVRRTRPPDPDPTGVSKRMVALDPGERHFQMYYDPVTGEHGELLAHYHKRGEDAVDWVAGERDRRSWKLDERQSRLDNWTFKMPGRTGAKARWMRHQHEQGLLSDAEWRRYARQCNHQARRRLVRLWKRRHAQLRAWREDAHYCAANHLLRNWDVVVVSTARFGKMCEKSARVFGKEKARSLLGWAHYEFRQRLKSAAFRYPGRIIVETTEAGTTGTCPRCGTFRRQFDAEVYRCPEASCRDVRVDRDVNGARNNLLWAFTQADHWMRAANHAAPAP